MRIQTGRTICGFTFRAKYFESFKSIIIGYRSITVNRDQTRQVFQTSFSHQNDVLYTSDQGFNLEIQTT